MHQLVSIIKINLKIIYYIQTKVPLCRSHWVDIHWLFWNALSHRDCPIYEHKSDHFCSFPICIIDIGLWLRYVLIVISICNEIPGSRHINYTNNSSVNQYDLVHARLQAGPCLNIKTVFPGMGISMLKIRQSWDCLIFNMIIPILGWTVFILRQTPDQYCLQVWYAMIHMRTEAKHLILQSTEPSWFEGSM